MSTAATVYGRFPQFWAYFLGWAAAPSKCDSAGSTETEIGLMLGFRSISPNSSPLDPWR